MSNNLLGGSSMNWDQVFDKAEHCSLCGDTNFMCECGDMPDHDSFDDNDYE